MKNILFRLMYFIVGLAVVIVSFIPFKVNGINMNIITSGGVLFWTFPIMGLCAMILSISVRSKPKD